MSEVAPQPESKQLPDSHVVESLGGIAAVAAGDLKLSDQVKDPTGAESTRLIANALKATPNNSSDSIEAQHRFKASVEKDPMAEVVRSDGSSEGLSHILFVGDSVLGVTRTFDATNKLIGARLAVLPLGVQKGDSPASSRTLMELDVTKASKLRDEGYVKPFEDTEVGKKDIGGAYGIEDNTVSGVHIGLSIGVDGMLDIRDGSRKEASTNGTQIMTLDTLSRRIANPEAQEAAIGLIGVLRENPYMWEARTADQTVVLPN